MTATTKRPPLARKVTNDHKKKRDEALDQGLKLTIDGEVYEARVGDVTAEIARELRQHTGKGFMHLVRTTAEDPDIDVISAFVWVARRVVGEEVAFEDVSISYAAMLGDDFEVSLPGAEDTDGDHPEG